jgi:trehalose-6-phosphate synthase
LTSALLVNPFSPDEMADAVRAALTMPERERRQRMSSLRRVVREHNIYAWGGAVMRELLDMDVSAETDYYGEELVETSAV